MPKNQICNLAVIAILLAVVAVVPAHGQTYLDLYNLGTNGGDPVEPQGPGMIVQGRDGNLYSTAAYGGVDEGAVFRVTPNGTLKVVYSFDGRDAEMPIGGLTLGSDGSFYGATPGPGYGIIFKVTPGGTFTVLHTFVTGTDGEYPFAPPIEGSDGNYYGTTSEGGPGGLGTVYRITSSGVLTTLYNLDAVSGGNTYAPFVEGTDGDFYTATYNGGKYNRGTIFKIRPNGRLKVLRNLGNDGNGRGVYGPLIQGSDGYFYGTAIAGGKGAGPHAGTAFKMTSTGKLTVLHQFKGTDGAGPWAGLVQATDGNFYGSTAGGGSGGNGVIYEITAAGSFSVLYNFDGSSGAAPLVTLVQNTNGTLYGNTYAGGTVSACHDGCGVFYSFDVGLGPFVKLVIVEGRVGKTIGILGQGFTGTSAVSFNGIAAGFTIKSDTYLTAIVPVGASTGFVTVTTPSGTLTSNKQFMVKAALD